MADPSETTPGDDAPETADGAVRRERIRQRAARWARLCRELSDHADELRSLRKELAPHGEGTPHRQAETADRQQELAQREARLQRELHALNRARREFELQLRQFAARQRSREESVRQVCDRRLLQAARFEFDARRRLAEAMALDEEYDRFEAALSEMTCEIEGELRHFDIEREGLDQAARSDEAAPLPDQTPDGSPPER